MAVKTVFEHEIRRNIGLSTDTKPHGQPALSTFWEYDARREWITYDGTNWEPKAYGTSADWIFGTPTLASSNNGKARWDRGTTSPLDQKGSTGWVAALYGGVQTGDDWARLNVPVNELYVPNFEEAMWSYYMTNTEVYGVNLVIWLHDPTDFDKRCEVTQTPAFATIEKTAGWNAHELVTSTASQFFFYGEGTSASALTAGTAYSWDQFQADTLFKDWTVYRVTFEYGWYNTGTFEDAWVADISLNGVVIPLGPVNGKHRKTVVVTKTLEAEGAYAAGDVISENDTNGAGTDWDFDFGGTGYIIKAVVSHATSANTARIDIDLYSNPPTCELDDNAAGTGPITADIPYLQGTISCTALSSKGTGHATVTVTPSTVGGLPLEFNAPKIYAVTSTLDAVDFGDDTLLTIALTAEMEDN